MQLNLNVDLCSQHCLQHSLIIDGFRNNELDIKVVKEPQRVSFVLVKVLVLQCCSVTTYILIGYGIYHLIPGV